MSRPEDTPGITEVPRLFTYHIFGTPSALRSWRRDISSWTLSVHGLVREPRRYSLHDLRSSFEPVTLEAILQCMTNIHWGRVRMRGARALDVLLDAGLEDSATKVGLRGGEGFTTDWFLEEVRKNPDLFLLVYEINDSPLTPEHGYPVRSAAKGKYGFKWCKWLTEMEAVDYDYKGHYEGRRGWSDLGIRGRPVQ